MWLRARIGTLVLLAAFAVGTITHAASATSMVAKMALSDSSDLMGVNCNACEKSSNEEITPTCDLVCTTHFTAILIKKTDLDLHLTLQETPIVGRGLVGRSEHKDPDPPRHIS